MTVAQTTDDQPTAQSDLLRTGMFVLTGLASAYTFGVLFLASSRSSSLFAWPMSSLSAATLGACYGGSCLMTVLAARADAWASVRSSVPPVLIVLALTLVAAAHGHSRLRLGGGPVFAFVSAWIWLGLNAILLIAAFVGLLAQRTGVRSQASRPARMPAAIAVPLGLLAAGLGVPGLVLLGRPGHTGWWPWVLGPVEAQMLGAWLVALAVGTAVTVREADLWRTGPTSAALGGTGLLGLLAVARYPGGLCGGTSGALYISVLAVMTVVGLGSFALGGPIGTRVT